MANATPLSLVDVSDIHEAMGSDPSLLGDATPAFESAIKRATVKLQTVLDTKFQPLVNEDLFQVTDSNPPPINGNIRLRLRNGLIREDQPVTVQWCNEVDGDFETVDNVVVHALKGFVEVPMWTPQGRYSSLSFLRSQARLQRNTVMYVKVNYTSGLVDGVDTAEDFEGLRQAIICFVPGFVMSTADTITASPKIMYAIMAKQKLQSDAADDMLRDYMRTLSPNIRPMKHTHTPYQI
jgi:hypothetical protein